MNCMVDSKKNYKFDLGGKGLRVATKVSRSSWNLGTHLSQGHLNKLIYKANTGNVNLRNSIQLPIQNNWGEKLSWLLFLYVGDVVCDPMCGGGSIPIEASLSWPTSFHLCGDHHELAPARTLANVQNVVELQLEKK